MNPIKKTLSSIPFDKTVCLLISGFGYMREKGRTGIAIAICL
jgi:hypothetical protein